MKSFLEKFKELSYEELLEVNGGYSTKSSSSNSTRTNRSRTTTKTYDPLTSGLENLANRNTSQKSSIPEGYDPKTGWLPGYGPNNNSYHSSTSGERQKVTTPDNQSDSVTLSSGSGSNESEFHNQHGNLETSDINQNDNESGELQETTVVSENQNNDSSNALTNPSYAN